jgi:hypothetical protein
MENQVSNIADEVIRKCGGAKRVAEICGCTVSYVHRWKYEKSRGGRNGRVPHDAMELLLAAADRGEVEITPADFFENGKLAAE